MENAVPDSPFGRAKNWIGGKRRAVATAVAACLLVGTGGVVTLVPQASHAMQEAASQLGDFLSRSPGERSDAELIKGKGKGDLDFAGPIEPEQRALGKIIDPLDEDFTEEPLGKELANTPVVTLPEFAEEVGGPGGGGSATPDPFLVGLLTGGGGGGGGDGSGGGGGGSGGGGGGGGGGGENPPPPPPPPPVSAVPEPESWLMMILGMGLCGAALRRRRKVAIVAKA